MFFQLVLTNSLSTMSYRSSTWQGSLFESLRAIAPDLFKDGDKYKLFARKVWPALARCRQELAKSY